MKKETFQEKLIKRFYGIAGPLDEFRQKEAFRLGNTCFILLFWGTMVLTLLAIALYKRFPQVVAYGYPVTLLLAYLSASTYIMFKLRHSQLDSLDVEELTTKEQKQLKGASIKFALYFTTVMYIWTVVFGAWMEGLNPLDHLFDLRKFLAACLGGVFTGIAIEITLRKRMKKAEKLTVSSAIAKEEPKWIQNMIKRFYGIRGPLDEYRRAEADAIGGQAFIYHFYFLALGNAIAYFLAIRYPVEVANYYPMIIALFSFILLGVVNMQTLHADLPQYDLDELSPEERQGRPLNPILWGLGVALLSTVFAGVADLFNLNLPLMDSILHTKSLLFGGTMGIFASIALSAFAYLHKLEAETAKKK
ncbi:TPA: DUF3278 domain-containing protein [Streptococcus suis]|uniref:DUF3278 domain-containing protein n=1 Tax=Streptococcus suis TaxID=1307 RepID=UPI000415C506|nr:DUF3278 domain-containing protein [Streptococcus suis]NQQ28972.1 DUF3278 domain-containing protein [Streptococcus suis]HEL2254219.1 DUF3278 domain-containing protein [Streptococcus suis]HEL2265819.1 DUF3278 domain-containing protein [Streptococcus suis]HEL2406431.1 DUF3278 domain-containing protein [Streptococcus suis]HEM3163756.1 DUF3278 domain-containing protein [Streptococcus suis 92-1191]